MCQIINFQEKKAERQNKRNLLSKATKWGHVCRKKGHDFIFVPKDVCCPFCGVSDNV